MNIKVKFTFLGIILASALLLLSGSSIITYQGGGSSYSVFDLTHGTAPGQVPQWNGTAWVPTTQSLGTGLQGSGTVASPYSVNLAGVTCSGGAAVTAIASDGSATCDTLDPMDQWNVVVQCGADNTGTNDTRANIQTCIDSAYANYLATGRRQEVYFPGGLYKVSKSPGHLYSFDLTGKSYLSFVGADSGLRSTILKSGNAGAGEWRLFDLGTGASYIYFTNLRFDGSGVTNPDPAEQDHLIELTRGAFDISIKNCEFTSSIGDEIRLLGEIGQFNYAVVIESNRFLNPGRAAISFQRYNRGVSIVGNYFEGGTDQQVDFEPTGYTFTASTGGTNTVLVCNGTGAGANTCTFTTWGIQPGDQILNRTTNDLVTVVSVDSQTQLTTTPLSGATTWANPVTFSFDENPDHQVVGNYFNYLTGGGAHTSSGVELCFTISGSQRLNVTGNTFLNCSVQGLSVFSLNFTGNTVVTGQRGGSEPAVQVVGYGGENQVNSNVITVRQTAGDITTLKNGVYVAISNVGYQTSTMVNNNTIRMEANGVGIDVEDTPYVTVNNNSIVKANLGTTGSPTPINVRATNMNLQSVLVSGNRARIDQGANGNRWTQCIQVGATGHNIVSTTTTSNHCDNISNGIVYAESSGGKFTNPPICGPNYLNTTGANQIGLPASAPWCIMSGVGSNTTMTLAPVDIWGTSDPNVGGSAGTKPVGAEGSTYRRKGGSAGARFYVNSDGVSTWTAVAGV